MVLSLFSLISQVRQRAVLGKVSTSTHSQYDCVKYFKAMKSLWPSEVPNFLQWYIMDSLFCARYTHCDFCLIKLALDQLVEIGYFSKSVPYKRKSTSRQRSETQSWCCYSCAEAIFSKMLPLRATLLFFMSEKYKQLQSCMLLKTNGEQ